MVDRLGVTVKLSLLQQLKGVKDRNCSREGVWQVLSLLPIGILVVHLAYPEPQCINSVQNFSFLFLP